MREALLDGNGQVDDDLPVRGRLQISITALHISAANSGSVPVKLSGEYSKAEVAGGLFAVLVEELCTGNCDVDYLLPALAENLLALSDGGGVIQVNYGVLAACREPRRSF